MRILMVAALLICTTLSHGASLAQLKAKAQKGNRVAQFQLGVQLYQKGKFNDAIHWLKPIADAKFKPRDWLYPNLHKFDKIDIAAMYYVGRAMLEKQTDDISERNRLLFDRDFPGTRYIRKAALLGHKKATQLIDTCNYSLHKCKYK